MNWGTLLALGIAFVSVIGVNGCGRKTDPFAQNNSDVNDSPSFPGLTSVNGSARFGSQCPFGSYGSPKEVPIELWNCPVGLPNVELNESLQPLILQADCKKKTIDVRGESHSLVSTTWEMMPDGTFYFSIDGGLAHLKNDGSGNKNCEIPLSVDMWGQVDCTDRDRAIIRVETVWWLGQSPHAPAGHTMPSPLPSGMPNMDPTTPFPIHSPVPTYTSAPNPMPTGISMPVPTPIPSFVPFLAPNEVHIRVPGVSGTSCKVPTGCYFHNITQIDQCT